MERLIVITILASTALCSMTIGRVDSFDLGRITWWKKAWSAAPITTSSDHQGLISLTFNYRVTKAVTSGVIEISGPGIVTTAAAVTLSAGQETYQEVSSIFVSASGILGPFKLVTRNAENGQIVDANYSFGSVYIADAIATSPTLTIADTSTNPSASPSHGATINLSFAFSIDYDMWEHDFIEIDVPLANNLPLLTPPASPICESLNTDSSTSNTVIVNHLCTDTTSKSCELLCEYQATADTANPANSVYKIVVYGFNKSLNYISSPLDAKISIDGFTLPSANYAGNEFSWTIRTKRFGTNYVYKEYTGTGPSNVTSIAASSVSVTSAPHRGMPSNKLFQGMSIYMDFIFTTSSAIPAHGGLTATFDGLEIITFPDDMSTQCVTSAGTCTVKNAGNILAIDVGASDLPAGSITVTIYTTFTHDAASVMVDTRTSELKLIDYTTISAPINMGDTASTTEGKATAIKIGLFETLANDTARNKGSSEMTFKLAVIPPEAVTHTDSLSFNCPLDTSELSKTKLYISKSKVISKQITIDDTNNAGTIDETLDLTNGEAATVTYDTDSISITTDNMIVVSSNKIYALGSIEESAGDNTVRAPMVTGNKLTYYECHGAIIASGKSLNQAAPFSVVNNDTLISGSILCNTNDTTGIPLVISIHATPAEIDGAVYSITLSGSNYFGLGTRAESTATGWKTGGTVAVSFTEDLMTVSSFGTIELGQSLKVYVPHGGNQSDDALSLFYTSNGVDHVVARVIASVADGTPTPYDDSPEVTLIGSNDRVGQAISINVSKYKDLGVADVLGINKIPPWWNLTDATYITDADGVTGIEVGKITSTDPLFLGQTIFGIASGNSMGDGTNKIFNAIKMTSENQDPMATYNVEVNNIGGNACRGSEEFSVASALNSVPFTSVVISPLNSIAKGPGTFAQDLVVTITTSQPIPQGGKIEFELGTFWEVQSSSFCTVAGLKHIDSTSPVPCTNDGAIYTINNFQEAPASSVILATITDANPASSSPVTPFETICIGTATSYDAMDKKINQNIALAANSCSSTTANPIGQSNFDSNAVVYHPNAGTRTADVHMAFSVNYQLPSGSTITITAPKAVTATKDTAFTNFIYTEVVTSGSTVTFTTGEAIASEQLLEFYLDDAFVLGEPGKSGYWLVSTSYAGNTITEDSFLNRFTVTYGPAGIEISGGTIEATVKNPGEYSSYIFSYTTPVAIEATDTIRVIFPMTYDPNVGSSRQYTSGEWRIECSSTVFPDVVCLVDHWVVVVSGLAAADVGSSVDLTIDFVRNPAAPGNAQTFGLIQMDKDGTTVDAIAEAFASFSVDTDPSFLDLRSVSATSTYFSEKADYSLWFYVDTNIGASDEIRAIFPMQYDVPVWDGRTLSCDATFVDESMNPQTTGDIDTSVSCCTISGNQVQWTASSTLASAIDLDSHDRVVLSLIDVTNAAFGLPRTLPHLYSDFYPSSVATEYEQWSSTFEVSIYDASAGAVTFKSFAHRNSAYIGFGDSSTKYISLQVGSYDAATMMNWLTVNAGQMSQEYAISFSNSVPLIADQFNFTGISHALGLFISNSTADWSFNLLEDSLMLRVSAPIGTAPGIFYILFTAGSEIFGSCQLSHLYIPGPKVMVEVISSISEISIASAVTVYEDLISYPIMVSLPYPPHTGISLNIDFGECSTSINATQPITFYRGETVKYMTIQSTGLMNGDCEGNYYLTGTDGAAYTINSNLTVTNKTKEEVPTYDPFLNMTRISVGSNTATIAIAGGGDGIAYMSLKCSQASDGFVRKRTIDDMKEKLTSVGMEVYDPPRVKMSFNATSNSFYQFLKDTAGEACYTERYVSKPHLFDSETMFSFDWLMDGQRYLAIAYVESYYSSSAGAIEFTTSPAKSLKRYTVIISSGIKALEIEESSDIIACQLADNLRVSQHYLYRHVPISTLNTTDNSTIHSTYTFDLMYNRVDSKNDPAKFAAFLSDTKAVESDIKTALNLIAIDGSVTLTISDITKSGPPIVGDVLPQKINENKSEVTYIWTPTNSGQWCSLCVARTHDNDYLSKPEPNSIPYGLSAGYNKSEVSCLDVIGGSSYTLIVSKLTKHTKYNCYHAFCSHEKLISECVELNPINFSVFNLDSASILSFIGLALAILLN